MSIRRSLQLTVYHHHMRLARGGHFADIQARVVVQHRANAGQHRTGARPPRVAIGARSRRGDPLAGAVQQCRGAVQRCRRLEANPGCTMKNTYPADNVPAHPDYVKSFQVTQNGTAVEVQGTQVTGVSLSNDKDKTSEMVRGKINMKADRYSGAQYVNIYAHNGTVGIWKEVEITSSGDFAARYLNTNQIKAVILWSTTGNGVLLEMN